MLKLVNVTKYYDVGGSSTVKALKGVNIEFRKNEFVSILGQSGCGKTTLLNIIGGLDRYTDGDLIINGRSTKEYRDHDWDTYRNHSIGFVFQSYNLIPHQTVLSNVELALTLSGVSKHERRKRAVAALEKVGLGDQLNKKPNQMSGGQMQRVAIARALINDPEILLADEPTGALDSETSEQIMALLKEVANDRLVIMVTHNPELAEQYSTRIIRVLDGKVIDDTDPYDSSIETVETEVKTVAENFKKVKKQKSTSMSFFTALSLSLNNLMTKKGRTFMTSFAGSIGIIGIALILSISSGFQAYIDKVQEDTLSFYPITIMAEQTDMSTLFKSMAENQQDRETRENDKVYANTDMLDMMNALFNSDSKQNDLQSFKAWIDSGNSELEQYISAIQYGYSTDLDVYVNDTSNGILKANDYMSLFSDIAGNENSVAGMNEMMSMMGTGNSVRIFSEMIADKDGKGINDLIYSQYELVDTEKMHWPVNKNQVLFVVNEYNEISESFLYALGLLDRAELGDYWRKIMSGESVESTELDVDWNYEDLVGLKFKLLLPSDKYQGVDTDGDGKNDKWIDKSSDQAYMKLLLASSQELEVVGIIRPKADAVSTSLQNTAVAYTKELTDWYLGEIAESEPVKYQLENPTVDVIGGLPFLTKVLADGQEKADDFKIWAAALGKDQKISVYSHIVATPDSATLQKLISDEMAKYSTREAQETLLVTLYTKQAESGMSEQAVRDNLAKMDESQLYNLVQETVTGMVRQQYAASATERLKTMTPENILTEFETTVNNAEVSVLSELYDITSELRYSKSSLKENFKNLGYSDKNDPSYVNIYASTFENKEKIAEAIGQYNQGKEEEEQITYTDYVAILLSSVSTIINIISYALIAFVSISLVVSSIMIGIITYISVLERTKEIGILRAIGASKKDISRVFNAETLIVGFVSGMFGVLVTILFNIPISLIIKKLADIEGLAVLPLGGAIILVLISMGLTLIAGLIPSKVAANKDPVEALRTE